MVVLFVSRKFPPQIGGMERYSADLIAHMPVKSKYVIALGRSQAHLLWWLPCAIIRAIWILSTKRPEVIHVTDVLLTPFFVPIARLFHIPIVATAHGLDVIWPTTVYQRCVHWALPRVDRVVAVSRATAEYCRQRGVSEQHISIIPNGIVMPSTPPVDSQSTLRQRWHLGVTSFVLLSLGRLVARKNIRWFIAEVMPHVPERCVLLVLGDGPERPAIERTLHVKGLESRVRLAGQVDENDKELALNGADIFIMPNRTISGDAEGFGIVAIEASSHGLPVVAARLEGIVDAVIDGTTGVLLKPNDANSFKQTIEHFVFDEPYRSRLSQQARQATADQFAWPVLAARYQQLYQQVIAQL